MKKTLLLLVLMTGVTFAFAQNPTGDASSPRGNGKISGIVKDSTAQSTPPVEFANVTLINAVTNKPVDGSMCDEKGKFSITKIPAGKYSVTISFLGYETKTVRNITITDKRSDIDLGSVPIGQAAKVLKEVVVEGQKALVEEKVDRTVYNAENDQTTKGGDATDVLKRVPMLSVDLDGNVSLRGSQNVKVLINNKPSTITASSISDALKQIPADQIKTVEVITSPSAKYDAEGSAGIINIVLKKNTMQGFTLNVDGSSGYRGSNLSLNGSYRKGKMGFSLGGFGRAQYNIPGQFQNIQTTNPGTPLSLLNIQNANTQTKGLGGNYTIGWDYDIDKKNSLAASVRLSARDNYSYQNNLITQTITSTDTSSNTRNVKSTNLSQTVDATLTYTHTFDKPQREFNVLALYSRNNLTNNFVSGQLYSHESADTLRTKNVNTGFNSEATVQIDYQTPLGEKSLLETGVKRIMRVVSSDYQYFNANATFPPPDYYPTYNYVASTNPLQLANGLNYNQNISAGYLSYTLSLPSGYSLKAGTRYEYTTIDAKFQNPNASNGEPNPSNIPAYGVLVPSINVSRKLKNGNVLKAAYNRRIQRPSIQYLNPNIQYSNQLAVTQGQTNLGPEYTDNFELAYSTYIGGSSLNFSSFMRNTNKSIQSIKEPFHPGSDTILTTYKNIGKTDAYGLSVFAGINISNKFTLNGGGDIYYAVLKNNDPIPQYNASNQGWVYNVRMFGNYKLDKGWAFQFFGFYRGRQVQLQGFQQGFGIYSLSIRKDLPNKKGSIGIGGDNFFTPAIRVHSTTTSPLIDSRALTVYHNMNFKISFSYRIGKMSFDAPKKRRKSISNDDQIEGGGDNPASGAGQQGAGGQNAAPAQGGQNGGQGQGGQKTGGQGQSGQGGQRPGMGQGQGQRPGMGQRPKSDTTGQKISKPDSLKATQPDSTLNPAKPDSTQHLPKSDSTKNLLKPDSTQLQQQKRDTTKQVGPPKKDN